MDKKYEERLLGAAGCGVCVMELGENLVALCERRGLGEECKAAVIEKVVDFAEEKIEGRQLIDDLKRIFGDNYELGATERETEKAE